MNVLQKLAYLFYGLYVRWCRWSYGRYATRLLKQDWNRFIEALGRVADSLRPEERQRILDMLDADLKAISPKSNRQVRWSEIKESIISRADMKVFGFRERFERAYRELGG